MSRPWYWLVRLGLKSKAFKHLVVAVYAFSLAPAGWMAAQVVAYRHPWFAVPTVALVVLFAVAFSLTRKWTR